MAGISKLLPIITQLGQYLKAGMDHYADLRSAGGQATPEIVAAFLYAKMESWKPTVQDAEILDDETRMAAARFLAGVAVNLAGA